MNDADLKSVLYFLSKQGFNTGITFTKPDVVEIGSSSNIASDFRYKHSKEKYVDGYSLILNFEKKTVVLYTWSESYHNGDAYNNKKLSIPWESLKEIYLKVEQKFTEHLKKVALERLVNQYAQVLRDQVLESGGVLK